MMMLQRTLSWLVLSATVVLPAMGGGRACAADSGGDDDATAAAKAKELLKAMTLDEKIGQMTQADLKAIHDKADIARYALGSVLSGGDSDPDDITAKGWAKIHDELQTWALKSRLKIPLIYGIDAVHGHNNVDGAVIFPHNIGLGGLAIPSLLRKPRESRRWSWSARESAGHSPPAWPLPATSGGAARTRASARIPSSPASWVLRRSADFRVPPWERPPRCWPRQALRGRRRHHARRGPGNDRVRSCHSQADTSARLSRGRQGGRRLGHGLVQ